MSIQCFERKGNPRWFLAAIFIVALSISARATTCIALKKFKVRQVCGRVQTGLGDVIPNAAIQVTKKGRPDTAVRMQTDGGGNFTFRRFDEGEYEIQVETYGFRSVSQEFELRRPMKEGRQCDRPILVTMQLAGGCSSVAKAQTKTIDSVNNAQTH